VTHFSWATSADILRCTFTEPFYNLQYSMTQSRITLTSPNGTSLQNNVSFQIMGPGRFQLRNTANSIIMRLFLDNTGSDGMSDAIYPYRARWYAPNYGWMWGGCTSNFLHKQGGE